jgi:hypothetical protein
MSFKVTIDITGLNAQQYLIMLRKSFVTLFRETTQTHKGTCRGTELYKAGGTHT